MKTAADYRIDQAEKVRINGAIKKAFRAFERRGGEFIYIGSFTAPAKTANSKLWEIARDAA